MYNYKQYAKTYPQYFMLHKRLPKGYIQQKYITATRQQYINTEFNINVGDKINVEVYPVLGKSGVIFCVFGTGTGQIVVSPNHGFIEVGHIHLASISRNSFKLNTIALTGINGVLGIFRAFGAASSVFEGNIYNLNVIRDNQVIMDLIPCLDDKGVPCLYDIINEKTYYSSSGIPFVKGE